MTEKTIAMNFTAMTERNKKLFNDIIAFAKRYTAEAPPGQPAHELRGEIASSLIHAAVAIHEGEHRLVVQGYITALVQMAVNAWTDLGQLRSDPADEKPEAV